MYAHNLCKNDRVLLKSVSSDQLQILISFLEATCNKTKEEINEDVCSSFFVVIWGPEELFLDVSRHRGKLGLQSINHLKAPRDLWKANYTAENVKIVYFYFMWEHGHKNGNNPLRTQSREKKTTWPWVINRKRFLVYCRGFSEGIPINVNRRQRDESLALKWKFSSSHQGFWQPSSLPLPVHPARSREENS